MTLFDDATEVYDFDTTNGITDANKDANHDLTDNNACGTDGVDFKQGDQSVDFNGSDESLTLADDAHFDVGTSSDYSWAFWFKTDADDPYGIVTKLDFDSSGSGWAFRTNDTIGNQSFRVFFANGFSTDEFDTLFNPTENTWYHVVAAWDDSGAVLTVWISSDGGTFGDTLDNSGAPEAMSQDPEVNSVDLGLALTSAFPIFDGHLDEVAFFQSKHLNATEAESIWDGSWRAAGGPAAIPKPPRLIITRWWEKLIMANPGFMTIMSFGAWIIKRRQRLMK